MTTTLDKNALLFVTVKNPSGIDYQGHAQSITSYNDTGVFDVLCFHANFISIIKNSVVIHGDEKKSITIPIEIGIMKVYKNTVTIFSGITTIS